MYSGGGSGQSEFHNDSQAQLQRMMQLDAQQQQQNSSQNNNQSATSTAGSGMFTPQMIRELLASAGASGITSSPMSAYEAGRKAGSGGDNNVTIQGMGSIQLSEGQRQAIKSMLMNDGGNNSSYR